MYNGKPESVADDSIQNNILINSGKFTAKGGDINITSIGSINLQAAQDYIFERNTKVSVRRKWYGKKTVTKTTKEDTDQLVDPLTLTADKDINIKASNHLYAYSTDINNTNGKLSLYAGDALRLFAAKDVEVNFEKVDKKSSFGILSFLLSPAIPLFGKRKEKYTNSYQRMSEIPTTIDTSIVDSTSGDDTYLQGTEFTYLKGASVQAGKGIEAVKDAKIIFDSINEEVSKRKTSKWESVVWQKMTDEGSITETAELPKFNGPTNPEFSAPGGLVVQVPLTPEQAKDKTNLVNVLNNMAEQPGYGYLKEVTKRKDVDFTAFRLAQEQWNYKQEGLTPAGAALIALAVTVATGGSGAAAASGLEAAMGAAWTSLQTQAAITLINNKGDIGKTLKDLGKSETVKSMFIAALTAGVADKLNAGVLKDFQTDAINDRIIRAAVQSTASAAINSAVNGTSFADALKASLQAGLANAVHGFAATEIKGLDVDYMMHKLLHAAAGCAAAAAQQKKCEAGIIGAVVGEVVAESLKNGRSASELNSDETKKILNLSKLAAGTVAAAAGYDVNTAVNSSDVAVTNNSLKVITTTIKVGGKLLRVAVNKGKVTVKDLKRTLKEEGFDIVDDLITLADGQLTLDDAKAIVDLVVGTDWNKSGKGNAANQLNYILNNRITHKTQPKFKVINVLKGFNGKNYQFGGHAFKLDKSGMKHILSRHHPSYWDGSVKARQTFFNPNMKISEVQSAITSVLSQNRSTLLQKGNARTYQISGIYKGKRYTLGLNRGRIGQFYPH